MIKNKFPILVLGSLFCVLSFVSCKQEEKKVAKKPNIIYIMTDDHTAGATGMYGGRLAGLNPTPNLDKLGDEGMVFNNCFVTNSICTPSRASIMSGQYSQTNGVLDLWNDLDTEKQYLPQEMKKLGYETAMIGKWHLHIEPTAFDYYKVLPGQGRYFDPVFRVQGEKEWPNNTVQHEGHTSDIITDQVLNWFENVKGHEAPFFLMYHFKAPHDMFEFNPKYANYLENEFIPEPESLYNQPLWGSEATRGKNDSLINVIGSSISKRHPNRSYVDIFEIGDKPTEKEATSAAYQEYLKKYLRCVKGVDDNLGRFFDYLKKNGLWENTVIVYTSDQGMMLGEHDFEDKRWMYEESMRMPFIVRYPEMVKSGTRSDLIVNNTDFAPTLIELAGGKKPEYMQGESMTEILKGHTPADWRTSTYYRYWMHMIHHDIPAHFGLRSKDHKLIFFYGRHYNLEKEGILSMPWKGEGNSNKVEITPAAWEFYDLKNDPEELVNQYNNPEYKEIIDKMKAELKEKRKTLNEEDHDYPHLKEIIDKHWND
ncbi:sulfatase family protein [Flavivirga eckloniae]|uniref:Acetylglucosamine-6-sulfatase n=1 Tax=Flavivirga eckloniae TaxID=1803846 RepID=A0A2K9PU08_9FLAO|nr:sulfatase [Flavivirga eckloniae]AUP80534.1 acetylglucosamine-6-sulfatase [Flavivirga eckloniae]